jgi:hypothetical protein
LTFLPSELYASVEHWLDDLGSLDVPYLQLDPNELACGLDDAQIWEMLHCGIRAYDLWENDDLLALFDSAGLTYDRTTRTVGGYDARYGGALLCGSVW